ncbi:MAG: AAA family ATPase [Polyangiaceae bacterium]
MTMDANGYGGVSISPAASAADLQGAYAVYQKLYQRLAAAVRGRDDVIDVLLIALLSDGHVLLEDYPGSGKTTLAKALGDAITDDRPEDEIVAFRRIQFTPDMLPSDVTGSLIFDPNTAQFSFRPGPIFAHVVLADEINRTSPKVQSAMLEAMGEKQVTVDNKTRRLDDLFFVVATQNPLDLVGTFPLPAAQLDRFLFKIRMRHIDRTSELNVLANLRQIRSGVGDSMPRVTRTEILQARAAIERGIHVHPAIHECLVDVAGATRSTEHILQGLSTRSLVLLLPALQARALARRREHVLAEDIEALAPYAFSHRLETAPGVDDVPALVRACLQGPIERLARGTLRR